MIKNINSIPPVMPSPPDAKTSRGPSGVKGDGVFQKALQGELEKNRGLQFSAHAAKRLRERNIALAGEDLAKISKAMNRAAAKGSRDSLIIYGDLALVASVRNKTVVTALDGKSLQEHVFTNIDSAVIVK